MPETPEIEEIILEQDRRGIAALRHHLPTGYCRETAQFILEKPGTVFIATGFYIFGAKTVETDGPPGALALGNALAAIGFTPIYVTDQFAAPYVKEIVRESEVVIFPMVHHAESILVASKILSDYSPTTLVAIERCAMTQSGHHRNMSGLDISAYTARLDYLFYQHRRTVGIGDGGNEIGFGSLKLHIPNVENLPKDPSNVATTHLIIASTSNWGAYGLIAAMSLLVRKNLLPTGETEEQVIRHLVDLGAVDGLEAKRQPTIDTFSIKTNNEILFRLHHVVEKGITA
jgi:hypothetical protein